MVASVHASKRVDMLREHRKKTTAKSRNVAPQPTLANSNATAAQVDPEIPSEEELLGEHIRIFLRNNPWCPEDSIIDSVGLPARKTKIQLKVLEDAGFLKSVSYNNSPKYALS
ncbi:MAG: hypothetical protein GY762_08155 [Proteobacteria bacterium]|nr:hypothetical protein [Pseudomonadota bacterium]